MRNENLLKVFGKYVSLNVLGMIALSCYILADTYFVSKALGAAGLAALNLAIPVYNFIHGSGLMIGMGGGTKFSIFKSQGKDPAANQIFTNAAFVMICIAAVFFALGLFASGPLVRLLGANEQTYDMSRIYLQVILLFAPMFMLNNLLLCFVRNDGAPQLSMAAMIGGSLSNVVLDYVFMFPLNMGIFGAVLATGLAPVISIAIMSPFFIKKKNSFRLTRCSIVFKNIGGVLSCGLPSLITEASSGIVIIVFNMIILGLEGNTGVAAYGVIANLSLVVIAIYTGIAQGIQPVISSQYGSGNRAGAKTILRYALIVMSVVSVAVYGAIVLFAPEIAGIFNGENNSLLQTIAVTGLKIYFTGCLFAGFNIIVSMYFTSTESPAPAQTVSILRGFVLILPSAFILSYAAGMTGVWSAFPVTEVVVAVIALILLLFTGRTATCA
ncbi:putative MATE family efflux protein [Catenibacillus scindens]|uniref:Multidrug export protein MepA n=1 Tax=Catenibacillus scindens TaxID=673271 RepID=A0A7W8M5S4_9FIRM|nr:putative MATE family efflux protein [Catenibacillus scindens]